MGNVLRISQMEIFHVFVKKGDECNIDINECETDNPCYKGKCHNTFGGYKCECENGYAGKNCDILIDECESRPCLNGGTCIDLAGDFKCICMPSWNGKNCEIPKPFSPACDKLMCMHGGVCRKSVFGEEFCQCSPRFDGKECEKIKADPCQKNKCKNAVKCLPTNDYNSYTCECKNGYGGEFCEQKIKNCQENPCLVGECQDTFTGFQCQCPSGYKGVNCEININECKPGICGNGVCIDQ
uniref:EGF-like domain-containing protein n=1 Tax=Panagrolaimus superbus TaxID=310955 RepID=A0A914XWF7_9BILA